MTFDDLGGTPVIITPCEGYYLAVEKFHGRTLLAEGESIWEAMRGCLDLIAERLLLESMAADLLKICGVEEQTCVAH